MKKILILSLFLFYNSILKADGIPEWHIKISFEDLTGKIFNCYVKVNVMKDSIKLLKDPIKLKLAMFGPNETIGFTIDTLIYYTNRTKYIHYRGCNYDEPIDTFTFLIGERKIAINKIKNVKFQQAFLYGGPYFYVDYFVPSDTNWMKIKPLKQYCYAEICGDYTVIIHRNSKEAADLIKALDNKQRELNNIEDKDSEIYYKVDKELYDLLIKIHKEDYVILISRVDC